MIAFVFLAVSLLCANAAYLPAYSGHAYLGGYPALGYSHAGYAPAGYAYPYAHVAPVEVEEKTVEVAAPVYHSAPAYGYTPYTHHGYDHGYVPTYASQYHSQDEFGQASYGYAQPGQAKSEVRDAYGNVHGSYYYINPEGKKVEVSYTAGVNGFQVHSNDLPVAPVDTGVAPVFNLEAPVDTGVAPEPVQDTPEVAAAKAAHAEAVAKAAEAAKHRRRRSVPALPYALPHHGFGYAFGYPAYATGYAHHAPLAYTHHAAPVYHAAPYVAPAHAAYTVPAATTREATLTRVILNPGHAEAYRVD